MADQVEVTPAAEYTVSTDDAGASGHVQRVKLALSADGSAAHATVDADGVLVNLGANNDVTVSGVSTAANQATANTALAAIQTAVEILDNIVSGSEAQVDIVSSALPSGAATAANQATANTALAAIQAAVEILDNAISGTEMQVDVVAALPAGTNNIGDVDVASIAAGDNNIGNVDIASALPAGTNAIGKLAANSGVDIGDVDVLSIAAGTNTIGAINVKPTTTGGLDIFRSLDLDETEEDVKTSAGQVFGWYIYNDGAAEVYVKLYNATAANVTVGSTTPVMTIPVPAGSAANVEFTNGIAFSTAITAAATTAVADADTGAPAANQVVANILYK